MPDRYPVQLPLQPIHPWRLSIVYPHRSAEHKSDGVVALAGIRQGFALVQTDGLEFEPSLLGQSANKIWTFAVDVLEHQQFCDQSKR